MKMVTVSQASQTLSNFALFVLQYTDVYNPSKLRFYNGYVYKWSLPGSHDGYFSCQETCKISVCIHCQSVPLRELRRTRFLKGHQLQLLRKGAVLPVSIQNQLCWDIIILLTSACNKTYFRNNKKNI